MNLRTWLTVAIAGVLLSTLVAVGFVLVRTTEAALTEQVDEQIVANAMRGNPPGEEPGRNDGYNAYGTPETGDPDSKPVPPQAAASPAGYGESDAFSQERVVGHFVYNPLGVLLMSEPCGFEDDPKSPPLLPEIPSVEIDNMVDEIVTTPSVDGSINYRVFVQRAENGNLLVSAATLDRVETAISDLQRSLLIIGLIALAASIVAASWLIRRGLRPVDRMVETAAAIADGDLTRRVPDADPRTELGRLGAALNDMLFQIEDSLLVRVRSEERLRRFVGDAAHELRTPLTSVRGYAELHRQGALTSEAEVANAMLRIEGEGNRMARLVDDLLVLARLDQQRALDEQAIDLAVLVEEAAADFQVVAPDHPLSTTLSGGAIVIGDQLRLRQVIDNLLTNARAHTPTGTEVRINLTSVDGKVILQVSDNGPGIPADAQELIFERFWRADPARTRSRGGSGLGLSIAGAIVEAHGGDISVASEPGAGTTFTVTLPATDRSPTTTV